MRIKPLPFSSLTDKQKARYWKHVNKRGPNECWPWTASVGGPVGRQQGQMTVEGYHGHATRVGWFIVHGFDPYPLHVLHTCDHGICHNPAHWFQGTNQDNINDRNKKGRGGRELTTAQVETIKMILRTTNRSQQSVANEYRVHQTLISAIHRGIVWKHVA